MRVLALLFLCPVLSSADEGSVEIRSLHVISDIRFRFAKTVVFSRVVNPSATLSQDVVFHVTLPNAAFITDFRFFSESEKNTRIGKIAEREAAKKEYKVDVQSGQTAGYLGLKNVHETNSFEVILKILPGDKVNFNLTYEEVLQRRQGLYHHDIYIDPGQPVPDMKIDVAIQESRDINPLKTPLRTGNIVTDVDITENNELVVVQKPSSKSAYIRFYPTLDQQLARWAEGISGLFTVMYDVERGFDAGDVLVSNGYFIHFFAPAVPSPVPKDVLFILDTSTSMFWGKLDQLKAAMTVILKDLNPDDRFNIITFGSRVVFWQDDMAEVKQTTNVQRAIEYLDELKALGWTNIMKAIAQGVSYLNTHQRSAEGSLIIFLTDGNATTGETNPKFITRNVRAANSKDIPLYTLAFGKNADWELMKKLAIQNFGIGKRIYTDGNPTTQIENFYSMVANTMLHGVTFQYSDAVTNSTQTNFVSFVKGSELIITGQIDQMKDFTSTSLKVTAVSSSGGVNLKPSNIVVDLKTEFQNLTSLYSIHDMEGMTRRIWAYLHIKELLKTRVGETDKDKREKLEQEALKLSFEHNLVTPMTAMVVNMPYVGDTLGDFKEDRDSLYYHEKEVFNIPADFYKDPYAGRNYYNRQSYSRRGGAGWDPHFMVYMDGLKYPICFDVHGEDNKIYQLVQDPQTGLTVNARMNRRRKTNRGYYMTEFAILQHDLRLQVTSTNMTLHGVSYTWDTDHNVTVPGAQFFISNISPRLSRLSIVFDSRLQIDITNHVHKKSARFGQNFLNIELGNEQLLSKDTDGLLGQFLHKKMQLEDITYKNGHLVGHLRTQTGLEVDHGRAQIMHREDPIWKTTLSCWLIKKMGARLFDGPAEYYIVNDMFQTDLI